MAEEVAKAKILPMYVVVDVSWSMSADGKIDAANGIIPSLQAALIENPTLSDLVRFALIDFSDDATVRLPLCDLSMARGAPVLSIRGGTSYAAAFRLLQKEIESNVQTLKGDQFAVHRPAVFFISDGEPTDDDGVWRRAFSSLTSYDKVTKSGFPYFPNFIPFGVGNDVRKDLMQQLIFPTDRSKAYFTKDGANPGEALRQMTEVLVMSTMLSGASVGANGPSFLLPEDSEDLGDLIEDLSYEDLL